MTLDGKQPKTTRKNRISVFFSDDEIARIEIAADEEGGTVSALARRLLLKHAGSVVSAPRGRPAQPEGKVGRPSGFAKLGPAGPNYAYRDIYNELQRGNNADRVLEDYKRVARDQAPTPQEWTAIKQEFRRRVEADEPLYYAKHPIAGQEWFEPSEPVYWDPTLGDLTV